MWQMGNKILVNLIKLLDNILNSILLFIQCVEYTSFQDAEVVNVSGWFFEVLCLKKKLPDDNPRKVQYLVDNLLLTCQIPTKNEYTKYCPVINHKRKRRLSSER